MFLVKFLYDLCVIHSLSGIFGLTLYKYYTSRNVISNKIIECKNTKNGGIYDDFILNGLDSWFDTSLFRFSVLIVRYILVF
jgi:hypothetical protein